MNVYLYVCRGSSGLLKVGRTCDPERRKRQLESTFRLMGQSVSSFEATAPIVGCPKKAEADLVAFVVTSGSQKLRGREWFVDALNIPAFEEAVLISLKPKQKVAPKRVPDPNNPSVVGTIRLRANHWKRLRDLMDHYKNRVWLEKEIEFAYARAFNPKEKS